MQIDRTCLRIYRISLIYVNLRNYNSTTKKCHSSQEAKIAIGIWHVSHVDDALLTLKYSAIMNGGSLMMHILAYTSRGGLYLKVRIRSGQLLLKVRLACCALIDRLHAMDVFFLTSPERNTAMCSWYKTMLFCTNESIFSIFKLTTKSIAIPREHTDAVPALSLTQLLSPVRLAQ